MGAMIRPISTALVAAALLFGCATSGDPVPAWTVQEPRITRDGERRLLTVVAQSCDQSDRKLACGAALSRARVLLAKELNALLTKIAVAARQPAATEEAGRGLALTEARNAWIRRAVTAVSPSDVFNDDRDDCAWVLARLDLSQMLRDPNAPVIAKRALENHLRSMPPPPAALPSSGPTSCDE